jgi:hypothetical protein
MKQFTGNASLAKKKRTGTKKNEYVQAGTGIAHRENVQQRHED